MTSDKCSVMSVEDHLEERVIKPGISAKVNGRNQLASREVWYSVKDAKGGSVAKAA